jgi:uncharacterized protein (TIGR02145 family)
LLLTIFKSTFFIASFICIFGNSGCIKEPIQPKDENQYGTLLINNKSYLIVKIGEQWWMAENLETSAYSSGMSIPEISSTDLSTWTNLKSSGKTEINYNWYSIGNSSPNLVPGWHIPSDAEWKTLEEHLGMDNTNANKLGWRGNSEGDKLKALDNFGWPKYDENLVWGTNESGFGAVQKACRMFYGNAGESGNAFFWTSTEGPSDSTAYYRGLDYKKSNIFRHYGSKNYGFAVRLVKD